MQLKSQSDQIQNQSQKAETSVLKFPADFLWGVSTSHFQIEGNPHEIGQRSSDWAVWTTQSGKILDNSTADTACDFFSRYQADVELIESLNLKSFRLSLNWPALCPTPGSKISKDNQTYLYYRKLLETLKEKGITTFVTLFHFCLPQWLAEIGGWNHELAATEFEKFTEEAALAFGDVTDFWLTINEPLAYVYQGYVDGNWPPGYKGNYVWGFQCLKNMLHAHAKSYHTLHRLLPDAKVSFTSHWIPFFARNKMSPFDQFARYLRDSVFNHIFFNAIKQGELQFPFPLNTEKSLREMSGPIPGLKDCLDYIGVNYYTRQICEFKCKWPIDIFGIRSDLFELETSGLGWEIYPRGLYDLLVDGLKPYRYTASGKLRDIYITENGLASMFPADLSEGEWSLEDDIRVRYITSHLAAVHGAINAGANVKGYLHWSLLDNFEWAEGLRARFGIVRVAYPTLQRTLRKSAKVYAEIAKNNAISHNGKL